MVNYCVAENIMEGLWGNGTSTLGLCGLKVRAVCCMTQVCVQTLWGLVDSYPNFLSHGQRLNRALPHPTLVFAPLTNTYRSLPWISLSTIIEPINFADYEIKFPIPIYLLIVHRYLLLRI